MDLRRASLERTSRRDACRGDPRQHSSFRIHHECCWLQRPLCANYLQLASFSSTITLEYRTARANSFPEIKARLKPAAQQASTGTAFSFSPPAFPESVTPRISSSARNRAGDFILCEQPDTFLQQLATSRNWLRYPPSFLPSVPPKILGGSPGKVLKQGVAVQPTFFTGVIQGFHGGFFINYFNDFGRPWRLRRTEAPYRVGSFDLSSSTCATMAGNVPLTALTKFRVALTAPEFSQALNEYRSAQSTAAPRFTASDSSHAARQSFQQTMPGEMGFELYGHVFLKSRKHGKDSSASQSSVSRYLFVFVSSHPLLSWSCL